MEWCKSSNNSEIHPENERRKRIYDRGDWIAKITHLVKHLIYLRHIKPRPRLGEGKKRFFKNYSIIARGFWFIRFWVEVQVTAFLGCLSTERGTSMLLSDEVQGQSAGELWRFSTGLATMSTAFTRFLTQAHQPWMISPNQAVHHDCLPTSLSTLSLPPPRPQA